MNILTDIIIDNICCALAGNYTHGNRFCFKVGHKLPAIYYYKLLRVPVSLLETQFKIALGYTS
ncbi:hypothetical protein BpHYR1_050971 [Brachionus plicatilis]|uniref:Uncharacterized protein n=1 Tax=Brachionus plicatilis TaxID=10195 RepID=A0A3M7QX79_BRAPC|nr:hypothetical protein BpHYR1_050971 [Brachionus plicatilis]